MIGFRYLLMLLCGAACLLLPDMVMAAGGKASALIVVADPRATDSGIARWWVDMYNVDPFMFGVWCTILTAALGVSLGFITDQIMKHTGLDLSKRTIVEH